MQASRFHILLRALSAALTLATLSAWRTASVVVASTSSPLPATPRPIATAASANVGTLDQNRIAATIPLGSPSSLAVGDGLIWVLASGSVLRIDPHTSQAVGKAIPVDAQAWAIALGEGALWVTTVGWGDLGVPNDTDAVSRIDPESGEVVARIKVSRGPLSLAVTPGTIWVVNFGAAGHAVTRIDAKTNQIVGEPIMTGDAPISLAVGDGSVWVANHDSGSVTRIDITTHKVVATIPVPDAPHRIAYGAGAVWVANWHVNSVSRIDPKANQVVGEPIPTGFRAGNMAVGQGSVWVTSDYRGPLDARPEDVVVVRIDVQTNQAIETIPVGGHPMDVAITEDAVWVSIQGPDRVIRIKP
jgi:YVTN family beta-propeller protein